MKKVKLVYIYGRLVAVCETDEQLHTVCRKIATDSFSISPDVDIVIRDDGVCTIHDSGLFVRFREVEVGTVCVEVRPL